MKLKEITLVLLLLLGLIYLVVCQNFHWEFALLSIVIGLIGSCFIYLFRKKSE